MDGTRGANGTSDSASAGMRHPGPQIWLAGDPAELRALMPLGVAGIITNTVVLRDLTTKYGQLRAVIEGYLEITDRPILVEVDGDSLEELMAAARAARALSPQIGIKIPTSRIGVQAHARLRDMGVRTMATTVMNLSQAILTVAAGASWLCPFVGPAHAFGREAVGFVAEIAQAFRGRPNPPSIIGGIIRNPEAAYLAYAAGADGVVTLPAVYWQMLEHPTTTEWNALFHKKWAEMRDAGALEGFVGIHNAPLIGARADGR